MNPVKRRKKILAPNIRIDCVNDEHLVLCINQYSCDNKSVCCTSCLCKDISSWTKQGFSKNSWHCSHCFIINNTWPCRELVISFLNGFRIYFHSTTPEVCSSISCIVSSRKKSKSATLHFQTRSCFEIQR